VDKRSAGVYECFIFNNKKDENEFNFTEHSPGYQVKLTYLPDPATNIAFFIMVGSSFSIAFIINLVNICRYHCDWRERIKTVRLDPNRYEMPESVRTSMASVYYDKYDINCQQAFLDALLKSGHAVKRTYENATQGIEINVSYKELTEKLRENLGNPSDWRPSLGIPKPLSRSMAGLRNRLGSFELPTIPINLPTSMNVSFPSDWNIHYPNWNLKVRISKFSKKWIYGCSENDTSVDEYKIHNENGRVVITPVQEKNHESNTMRNRLALESSEIRERTTSSASVSSSNFSSESYRQLSTLIDATGDDPEEDFIVTIYATPNKPFDTSCLYESNV